MGVCSAIAVKAASKSVSESGRGRESVQHNTGRGTTTTKLNQSGKPAVPFGTFKIYKKRPRFAVAQTSKKCRIFTENVSHKNDKCDSGLPEGSGLFDQPFLKGVFDDIGIAVHVHLLENPQTMGAGRAQANRQLLGDMG